MRFAVVLACWSLLASSGIALAGDNKAESDKLFAEGLSLFEKKDFVTARQKFAGAYAKYPSPNSLLNLARAEQLSDHCVDAIVHYRAYITLPENPRVQTRDRDSARTKMNDCLAKVARINLTAPSSVKISLDGNAIVWTAGDPIDVEPGTHRLDLVVGSDTKTRSITLAQGQIGTVEWEDPKPVEPPPPPPPVPKPPEPTPVEPTPPVVVQPPEPPPQPPVHWKQQTHWPTGKVVSAIGLGVLGVVSFITAPAALAASESNARAADALASKLGPTGCSGANPPADCASLQDKRTAQNQMATVSNTFFVVGSLFVIGAVIVLVAWPNVHPLVTAKADGFAFRF